MFAYRKDTKYWHKIRQAIDKRYKEEEELEASKNKDPMQLIQQEMGDDK